MIDENVLASDARNLLRKLVKNRVFRYAIAGHNL